MDLCVVDKEYMMQTNKIKHVVWDWNGTLLDDVEISLQSINYLLQQEGVPELNSLEAYRKVFQFPIVEYYEKVGFDFSKTPFFSLADAYVAYYQPRSTQCELQKGAIACLQQLRAKGVHQYIISASNQEYLLKQVSQFSISDYFEDIIGLDDIHAYSKMELAQHFLTSRNIFGSSTLFIGDSVHDAQVADAASSSCVLIANGHEHRQKLLNTNQEVLDNLFVFYEWCRNHKWF